MPRLPRSLLLRAHSISPLFPLVLRGCRTLPSAIAELRWLREHVEQSPRLQDDPRGKSISLLKLCRRRARGEPLQYILGSQPFGELDIKCRPGVLIPRPETEAYTKYLAQILLGDRIESLKHDSLSSLEIITENCLRIVDFCSGSGCISLLLHSLLHKKFSDLQITGIDISTDAIALAGENLEMNVKLGHLHATANSSTTSQVCFTLADIFDNSKKLVEVTKSCDIIISNPPYISQDSFIKETSRSVRNWEPKLALVPQPRAYQTEGAAEDVFYYRLLQIYARNPKTKMLLMEIGDASQALRVTAIALALTKNSKIEIWRDWPDQSPDPDPETPQQITVSRSKIPVRGSGNLRAVVLISQNVYRPD